MKKLFILASFLIPSSICWLSCSNNNSALSENIEEYELKSKPMANRLADAFEEIAINKDGDYDEGAFIVYDTETDELLAADVFSYGLGQIAAVRSGEMSEEYAFTTLGADPPKNQGWIYFDTCKGKVNSLKLAMRLNKVIPQNADFEIYVEHPKDGSSKVWYRLT